MLFGNLAPRGAVVKESAVLPEMLVHRGPAMCFDDEATLMEAIEEGKIVPGTVVVIRYVGPKGGPGMPEMLTPTSAIAGAGLRFQRGAHHRRPLQRRQPGSQHRPRGARGATTAAPSLSSRTGTSSASTSPRGR